MLVIIDNQDSFTFNLYRYCCELGVKTIVLDSLTTNYEAVIDLNPSHLLLSPGPGHPSDAHLCLTLLKKSPLSLPILGVCLGHQAMALANGARIIQANKIFHGKPSMITHNSQHLFNGLENPIKQTRYHSLIIEPQTLSQDYEISALSENNDIMAIRHRTLPRFGVQFHPEAILSNSGHHLLSNFLNLR